MEVRPIFVLGSPRSGTTMFGQLLGSSAAVCYLGEYTAFFNASLAIRNGLARTPFPYKDQFFAELELHAVDFARRTAVQEGARFFCDSTPWNLQVATRIVELMPDAVFVLMLRHYAGVVQSLARSYDKGFQWAGADWEARGQFWSVIYSLARNLPPERTVPVSYDEFCATPEQTLRRMLQRLEPFDIVLRDIDVGVLAVSHATFPEYNRDTVATKLGAGTVIKPMSSYDAAAWTPEVAAQVEPKVIEMHSELLARYPDDYVQDPVDRPSALRLG